MSKTICGVCGGELEGSWVRFHYAKPYTEEDSNGHYIDGGSREIEGSLQFYEETAPFGAEEYDRVAPPPPDRKKVPRKLTKLLVPQEEDIRWDGISFLRIKGYRVYNMEQGYRPEGGHTRVGVGIADTYFQGHGVTGWIEFKRPEGKSARDKMSADQKLFEKWELENGGLYLLIESTQQLEEWDRIHRGKQLELQP